MSDPVSIKLVVVGDGAVGKTCMLSTYAKNKFPEEYVPTIFDNTTTTIKVNDTIVNLSLWYFTTKVGIQLVKKSTSDFDPLPIPMLISFSSFFQWWKKAASLMQSKR